MGEAEPALSEHYVDDSGVIVLNDSEVSTGAVMDQLRHNPEVAALISWSRTTQGGYSDPRRRDGGLFERDRYVTPDRIYDQFEVARDAMESDDVVGSIADASEAMAFKDISIECDNEDETDIWEQIAEGIDLDSRMREIWREEFATSNVTLAVWWGTKSFKVRGKTSGGNAKRKTFDNLKVPVGMTVLDPMKVVPVGNFLFSQETLCYRADRTEQDAIDSYLLAKEGLGYPGDPPNDQVIARLIQAKFEPGRRDRKQLGALGVDVTRLYVLNPDAVYRQTATRSGYQRFSPVRMKSVFELLDLKHQLRQSDRAHLLGASKFILLIRKGSDALPAQQAEMDNLNMQAKTMAQLPVLIGDHRLDVKIITPALDHTLDPDRHLGLDIRIAARLYGMFLSSHSRGDDSVKLTKVVARGLEGRREAQRRSIMRKVFWPCYERNDALTAKPVMQFHPRRIALDFDPALAAYLLDLRDRGDLSRDSILSEIDYSEAEEAHKREVEAVKYDHIFQTSVPYSAPGGGPAGPPQPNRVGQVTPPGQPGPTDPKAGGRRLGGNKGGGGAAPGSGQGKSPVRPKAKMPKPAAAVSDLDGDEPTEGEDE